MSKDEKKVPLDIKKKSSGTKRISFNVYIRRIQKIINQDHEISKNALSQLNSIMGIIATDLSVTSRFITGLCGRKTVNCSSVQAAVKLRIPGEISINSVKEGVTAVDKFQTSKKAGLNRRETHAELIFSVSLAEHFLRGYNSSTLAVSSSAPVFLAATLEYICKEILDLASQQTQLKTKKKITVRHMFLGIANDHEFPAFFRNMKILMTCTGVLQDIPVYLLDTKEKKAAAARRRGKNEKEKTGHRFRPGTVALRKIRNTQKTGELLLQKLPVERIVRHYLKNDTRLSSGAAELVQSIVEPQVVSLFEKSRDLAHHAGRQTVQEEDLHLVLKHADVDISKFETEAKKKDRNAIYLSGQGIDRLSKRAAVKRLQKESKILAHAYILYLIEKISTACLRIVEVKNVKTLSQQDVVEGCKILGINVAK